MKRVVRKCINKKCKNIFGVIQLKDKKGKVKCPFCGYTNKLSKKQIKEFS